MLDSLFPSDVRTVCLTRCPADTGLLPEEEPFVRAAVEKQRLEFTLGRVCARMALTGLGFPSVPLPVGADRAPVWPEGIVGSISHCSGLAGAAVARGNRHAGLGLDIEPLEPVDESLFRMIATPREHDWLAGLPPDESGRIARLLFSAKESVYKALNPLLGVFLGFQDCEVMLDLPAGTFSATVQSHRLPASWNGRRLEGRHAASETHLATGLALPPPA